MSYLFYYWLGLGMLPQWGVHKTTYIPSISINIKHLKTQNTTKTFRKRRWLASSNRCHLSRSKRSIWRAFGKVRRAYGAGQSYRMRRILREIEWCLASRFKNINARELDNYTLWLHLLWAKFHRMAGPIPKFFTGGEVPSKRVLIEQKRVLDRAFFHLKRISYHLRLYNELYRKIASKANIRSAVTLVNTLNQQSIIKNTIQIIQLRMSRIYSLIRHWDDNQQRDILIKKIKDITPELERLQTTQENMQKQISLQNVKLKSAQTISSRRLRRLKKQNAWGTTFIWSGSTGLLIGVGLLAAGIGYYVDAQDKKYYVLEARQRLNKSEDLLLGSSVIGSLGFTLFFTGILIKPSKSKYYQVLYDSHKHYLDWEEKLRNKQL